MWGVTDPLVGHIRWALLQIRINDPWSWKEYQDAAVALYTKSPCTVCVDQYSTPDPVLSPDAILHEMESIRGETHLPHS